MTTLSMSVQFPATPPTAGHPPSSVLPKPPPAAKPNRFLLAKPLRISIERPLSLLRAIEKSKESYDSSETTQSESESELDQIGSEMKKAMEEQKASSPAPEEEGILGGVAAEIKEIEWPMFGKVLGTTWVVLGVIAGSSVVLLTLNVVLAEISDKVFAGRGVQDFFG